MITTAKPAADTGSPTAVARLAKRCAALPAEAREKVLAFIEFAEAHHKIGGDEGSFDGARACARALAAARILGVDPKGTAKQADRTINLHGVRCEKELYERGVSLDWLYRGDFDLLRARLFEHWGLPPYAGAGATA